MVLLAASLTDLVINWVQAGGPFILFSILLICGLGLPLPEDIPLITAGALVANEKMPLAWACVAAWCGIIGGDMVLYHLGRKFGLEVTRLPFVGKHLTRKRIEHVEKLFDKYGIWVVAIGRLFAGIRGAMVVAAGTIKYSRVKFLIADGLAAIVSGGLFVALGYWLGQNLPKLIADIDRVKNWVLIGFVTVVLIAVGIFFWGQKRAAKILHEDQEENPPASDVAKPSDTPPHSPQPKKDNHHSLV